MTDEEKAKEMCKGCIYEDDHINCDCPSEYVYLAGLAEGKKEKQQVVDTQTVEIESRDVYLAEKESIIIRQQIEIQNLEKENASLSKMLNEAVVFIEQEDMQCKLCSFYLSCRDEYCTYKDETPTSDIIRAELEKRVGKEK